MSFVDLHGHIHDTQESAKRGTWDPVRTRWTGVSDGTNPTDPWQVSIVKNPATGNQDND